MKPTSTSNEKIIERPYQCQLDISFPTSQQALHAKEVLEVDGEIGDQITKSFQVKSSSSSGSSGNSSSDINGVKNDTNGDEKEGEGSEKKVLSL